MKKFLYLFSFFLLLFAVSCNENSGDATEDNQIIAKISDADDNPVEGAIISAYIVSEENPIETDTTDALGIFILKKLGTDIENVNLSIKHCDFEPVTEKLRDCIQKSGNNKKNVRIKMEAPDSCCGKLLVNVIDLDNSSVIPNAELKIKRENKIIRIGKTNEAGIAKFVNLCPGEYSLYVHQNNYQTTTFNVLIENCDTVRYTFPIESNKNDTCCNGRAIIYIKNLENSPVAGVNVKLWKGGDNIQTLSTNELGRVVFENLCPGSYGVSYMKENYSSAEFDFSIECNGVYEVNKQIQLSDTCCNGKMKIFVKDSTNNEQLNGAVVRLYKNGSLLKTSTVEAGKVVFENLCQGNYGVDITKDGYAAIEFPFEIGCNQVRELTKKLIPTETECCNNRLQVIVRDSISNDLISSATVKIMKNGQQVRIKTTESAGSVVFEELCKGTYTIIIQREGYAAQEYHVTFECGQNREQLIRIKSNTTETCCTGKLKLRIKNLENQFIENAEIKLRIGADVVNTLYSGGEGWVLFENICVPPSEYNIRVYKDGYKVKEMTFNFNECKTIQETVTLEAAK